MCRRVVVVDRPDLDEMWSPDDLARVLDVVILDADGSPELDDWREVCFCCSDPTPAMLAAGYTLVVGPDAQIFDHEFRSPSTSDGGGS